MNKGQIWETRPLEFWDKAKELRAQWQAAAGEESKIIGQGNCYPYLIDWAACFPGITPLEDNPGGSMIQAKDSPYARKCRMASEIRGWGREICGYINNLWGSMFLGYEMDGSPFPPRQFVIPMPCECDQHAKRGQQVRDFDPVPQWMGDQPIYFGEQDPARDEPLREHKVYSVLRQINDLERIFDQKFNDEKLSDMIRASNAFRECVRDLSLLMATSKPTPLSIKDMYSIYTIGGLTKVDPEETVRFWKSVRDEVEWRARNRIAAVGNERFRWIEAHPPSWHYLKYYRYMEQYGAVCMGSIYSHMMGGILEYKPDGSIDRRDAPVYAPDTPVKTREDGIRVLVGPDPREPQSFKSDEYLRRDSIVEFAGIMQADGALLPLWRCGVGCTLTRKEQAMRLREAGLSVIHYEGSQPGDRTDMDETRFLDQLDTWMESLGLEKLELR
ncbi:MAG: 2-hydroxyacyl-CoA dehydratase [Peptococcaceae bacterium]|jgi:benzoyl-CoA reductase subunit B|nr:2-hydroxyacyl-CoA dehydratase [Peptococcaceae bacterium]